MEKNSDKNKDNSSFSQFLRENFDLEERENKPQKTASPVKKRRGKRASFTAGQARLKLKELLENCFMEEDIDDRIESEWLNTFQRIDEELADINSAVPRDKVFAKKEKDAGEEDFEKGFFGAFSGEAKLAVASLVVLFLISAISAAIPELSRQREPEKTAFNENGHSIIRAQQDKPAGKIDKEDLSEYIKYNRENLKSIKEKGIDEVRLSAEDIKGRVAGVSEEVKNNGLPVVMEIKKNKIEHFFAYLKLLWP